MVEAIEVKNLSVHYETLEALSLVNMVIERGKLVLLLGPNGAGKSTLISAISGLLYDRIERAFLTDERLGVTGSIVCDGEDITILPPYERVRLGIIHCPEKRRLFADMGLLDNLLMGAYLRKDRQGVEEDLEKVFALFPELVKLKNREAGFLSGGEQQMVAIARALMSKPRFLLMDEPMAGLAPGLRERMKNAVFSILDTENIGVLITEQSSRVFLEPRAKIYVIGRGTIIFEGTAKEAMEDEYLSTTYFSA